MTMALVLVLSLQPPLSFAQAIVIALLHCSPKEHQREATVLITAVFIEARNNNYSLVYQNALPLRNMQPTDQGCGDRGDGAVQGGKGAGEYLSCSF